MFEYVYTKKQYKRSVRMLLLAWLLNFTLRSTLLFIYGFSFIYSATNMLLIMVSGIIVGLLIRTFVLFRKSAPVDVEEKLESFIK